ncbi:MAG: flagellar hook-length control protein FliK [Methylobacterium sp.]|nr:flagellar hook-length control protein FliK [Methylobacterium sp.]MCA3602972.1 flagellar hook-length control protein FliK [Methylobacterium sp.]MCA4909929.1 flagellar hook-length control protein FliK [Methylobacterium sp.]
MIEIASPSSFPSVAEPVPPGQRDTKTGSGSVPTVPFGSLVSQAAENPRNPIQMQDEAPAPRTPTAEEEARATARREALEGGQQAREKPARSAEGAAKKGRAEKPAQPSDAEEKAEKAAQPADAEEKAETASQPADAEKEAETAPVAAEATADPALAPPAIEKAREPALAVPVPAVLAANGEAEGENSAIAAGVARSAVMVAETPAAAILTTIAMGEIPAGDGKVPAGVKGSADLIALMQAQTGETAANAAMHADQAATPAEVSKVNFADWINEFALAQGAMHRSGDLVGSLDRALAAIPTAHAGQDALRPTPLQMLPIEIGMQAVRGVKTFQIRLDPAELGRVDVKLEFKEDGEVKASLVVDRVETLAMLKRDAPTLQQAFEQAGLRQSPDGLSFQLRGEQQGRDGQRENGAEGKPDRAGDSEEAGAQRPAEFVMRRVMIPNSSLDLVV